ncbi:methyltransferase domain-containing protein [Aliarcobacter butzleri]|uniref:methyltransferase domain-containing protein n=1 Tax=Aliarcobacter butzleri TaxID=28197 RepID=UPI001EDBA493|nr:methyltransferase domain-containing protein [Aliarcobacter butzleri]MCG3676900.1 methyltransferase domain-containing protein [Aliarcobacter butzleri]
MSIKELNRICPICNNSLGMVLHKQNFILEDDNPLPNEYDVVSCEQCSFIFADVEVTQNEYNLYYEAFSKYDNTEISSGGGNTSYDAKRLNSAAEEIMKYNTCKTLKILDIGAALGGLLNIFKEKGYHNLFALEPSLSCVKNMLNNNIKAFQGTVFSDFNQIFNNQKFDVIVLSHVMEHIYDLKKAIANIKSILGENGKIYIEVPDASRYKDFYVVPYYYFDIEHINHFSTFHLSSLMNNYGFKTVKLGEKTIPVSKDIDYPACYGIFENYIETKKSLEEYIEISKKNSHNEILEELISNNIEVVIWGAGNYTKRLLSQTNFLECSIKFFVDKDKNKQNTKINGIKIFSPEKLKGFDGVIIVCSALFYNDIIDEIKNMGYLNKIFVLR